MIEIFALKDNSADMSFDFLPAFVWQRIGKEGYYTLVAIDKNDGADDEFRGITQFYVDMDEAGVFFADLGYIYVVKSQRFKEIGLRLFHKVEEILSAQNVELITTALPFDEKDKLLSDVSAEEVRAFLKECGFITARDKEASGGRLFKITRG